MDLVKCFGNAVRMLVRDRLVLPQDQATVEHDHPLLPAVACALEAVFDTGLHDGSRWWDCWNCVLTEVDKEGLPEGLWTMVGHNQLESRRWLVNSMQCAVSLEELMQRVRGNTSALHAYYTDSSPLYDHDTPAFDALLKTLSQLSSLEFDLNPDRDVQLFDGCDSNEEEPLALGVGMVLHSPPVAASPTPPCDVTPSATPPAEAAPPHPDTVCAAVQVDFSSDVTQRALESRLDLVQKQEMQLLRSQLEVQEREALFKKKERHNAEGALYEEDLMEVKELLLTLTDVVPEGDGRIIGFEGMGPGAVPLPVLAQRIPAMLQALNSYTPPARGTQPQATSAANLTQTPAAQAAPAATAATAATAAASAPAATAAAERTPLTSAHAEAPQRARSPAMSPTGAAQVISGSGVDALDGLDEDFFCAGSDDESTLDKMGATPIVNESFHSGSSWRQFEGYDLREIGDVKRDLQFQQQGNCCAGCGAALPTSKFFRKAQLCEYSGQYFCPGCHKGEVHVLPSLVVNRWDFTPGKVCDAAHWHLRKLHNKPILDIGEVNPVLYKKVESLEKSRRYRQALVRVMELLEADSNTDASFLPGDLKIYEHCLSHAEVYTLQEMCTINSSEATYIAGIKGLLRHAVLRAECINPEQVAEVLRQSGVDIDI